MKRRKQEMAISEAELRAMTADMVEMHHATFPQMRARLAELGHSLRGRQKDRDLQQSLGDSRRRFLLGSGGLVASGVLLAACGDDDDEAQEAPAPAAGAGGAAGGDDASMELMKLNASLENLAVFAYGAALEAAEKGKFGKTVPDAVAGFAQHAKMQHQEHADAFNAAVTAMGGTAFTEPTPALVGAVKEMFAAVDSVPELALLALKLENTAAATYVSQMDQLTNAQTLDAVSTIAPVERQHAAILYYVLGEYPVPDTFVKLDKTSTSLGAQKPDALTAA